MTRKVELAPFIEEIYKDYSLYVLQNRAIPDWTGLKRTPIKALWSANTTGRKFLKTSSFGGSITLHTNYHHAPEALIDTISKMAQNFPGSNNLPLMEGEGAFGSQTVPNGIAAPRYTELRLHKNFDALFPAIDFHILPNNNDPENPEPEYLAPLLPITLVNGIQGIAVGYATKIFPRNINSLIDVITAHINNKKIPNVNLLPYYNGYKGEVKIVNDKVILSGSLQKEKNDIIRIVEVPFKHDLESYKDLLFKMKDNDKIKQIVCDNSSDVFDITVKVSHDVYELPTDTLLDYFDLKMNLNENITVIDRDNKVLVFTDVLEYIKYFADIRLNLYTKRKNYLIDEIHKKITNTMIKVFITNHIKEHKSPTKQSINDYVISQYDTYKEFFADLEMKSISKTDFTTEATTIISNIRLLESTVDKISEYSKKIDSLVDERSDIINTSIQTMYTNELKELKKYVNGK